MLCSHTYHDVFHEKCDKSCFSCFLSEILILFDFEKMPRPSKRKLQCRDAVRSRFDKQLEADSSDLEGTFWYFGFFVTF